MQFVTVLFLISSWILNAASQSYSLNLFGNLSVPAAPIVLDDSIIVMMSLKTLQGFSIANPTVPLWTFMMDDSFCCNTAGSDANSALNCGTAPGFNVIQGRGMVLVSCGPYLAVLNTTTGENVSAWYTIPDGDGVSQVAVSSTYNVALVSLQSCLVLALKVTTWELLWHANASHVPPLVATAGELAIVFSFTGALAGSIDGYSIVTGKPSWNVDASISSSQESIGVGYPWQSKTVFAWCGPSCATLRMLHIPTGAYHQWIPDSSFLQYAIPTDSGLVVVVLSTRVTVINASTGAAVWSAEPGTSIATVDLSFGGDYFTVYPPAAVSNSGAPQATTVYTTANGVVVGNCGYGQCSVPCVTRPLLGGTLVMVAKCASRGQTVAVMSLLNLRTSQPIVLDGPPVTTISDPIPAAIYALTETGLVAVISVAALQYMQIVVPPPSPPSPSLTLEDELFIGAAVALCVAFAAVVIYRQRRHPASTRDASSEQHLVERGAPSDDDDGSGSVESAESVSSTEATSP